MSVQTTNADRAHVYVKRNLSVTRHFVPRLVSLSIAKLFVEFSAVWGAV